MAEDQFEYLLKVLRDRDIPYERHVLEANWKDPEKGPAMQDWVKEYLAPDTLLTKEEATIYSNLVKSGAKNRLEAAELSQMQPISEQELQLAIEELKRSTAKIEKQNEILKLQQNALKSLITSEGKGRGSRADAEQKQWRQWDAEEDQLDIDIQDLSQALRNQVMELEQQANERETTTKQTVDRLLKADDKMLSSFQKLANDLKPSNPEKGALEERIRELCARLIKYTVEGIRTKLDRVYLETLGSDTPTEAQVEEDEADTELREELESLYAEILPVAQMKAEQQFLHPALKIIAETDGRSEERALVAFKYINDCLLYLGKRNERLQKDAEANQAYNAAVNHAIAIARKELSQPLDPNIHVPAKQPTSDTPRRRKSSVGHSPPKVRTIRRRSSGSGEVLEPEQQIARNLGINLPSAEGSQSTYIEALERIQTDRLSKLDLHLENLQLSTESGIQSHLNNAHLTLQLLQDTLLSETPFTSVKLMHPELVESVETFGQDVQYVQSSLDEINLQVLQERNIHRDQLVERWVR